MEKRAFKVLLIIGLFFGFAGNFPVSAESEKNSREFLSGYLQTAYNSSKGFPTDEANAVMQTTDGYMWFATYNGLVRYDGDKFILYTAIKDDGFDSTSVRALYEGGDGGLWIGTNDNGLVRYEKGEFIYFNKEKGAPSNIIRSVAENNDGIIYCGTAEGIFYVDTNADNPEEYAFGTVSLETDAAPFVISIDCDEKGNIYTVLNSGELYALTPEGKTVRMDSDSLFYSVLCTGAGKIVAGSQDTTAVFAEFDGNVFLSESVETGLKNTNTIFEDSSGRIWLGADTGIGFFEDDGGNGFTRLDSLEYSGYFTGIYEDYENGFWFTSSSGGVIKLTLSAFVNENVLYGVPSAAINALLKHNGLIYAAADDGLLIIDPEKEVNPVKNELTELFNGVRTRDVYLDSKGFIWFCTYSGQGVIRYDPESGETESILVSDGLNTERTRRILELKNGCYAVATAKGVNFLSNCEVITAEEALGVKNLAEEMPETMALCLYEADDGTLYIGTDGNGLYAIKDGKVKKYDENNGLSGSVILAVVGDPERNGVWISTNVGLCFIFNETLEARYMEKIPPYSVFDLLIDGDSLWLLTSGAILKVNVNELFNADSIVTIEETGRSAGLTSSINANSRKYMDENKRLYICCDKGINSIAVDGLTSKRIPNAAVNYVEADGVIYQNYDNEIIIPRNTERLTFELSLLSFGFNSGTTMHYMLEGQDRREITLDSASEVSYTNLPGGRYTFVLYPSDRDGNKGEGISISIMKEYGFFEHLYVQVIIAVFLLALVILLSFYTARIKNRASLKKQEEYRSIVTQSISAIANAIDAKDAYTKGHSARVASYSAEIALKMGYDKRFVENIYYIGLLHDVGKIGIPSSILNKPDKLTEEEFEIIKAHPKLGTEILKDITTIRNLNLGAAEHHERWDGRGYNNGLKGEEISVEGRIISAADAYDAMSSDRAYRKALPKNVIASEFTRGSGSQFDPSVAEVVSEMISKDMFRAVDLSKIISFR